MDHMFTKFLALLMALCLLLTLAPAAMMEVVPETEAAEEIVSDAVEGIVEEEEELPLEAQAVEEEFELTDIAEETEEEDEVLSAAATGTAINEINFPDSVFRDYVKSVIDNGDGILTASEIANTDWIGWVPVNPADKINSLKGIEYFTSLTTLDVLGNNLTTIDISRNTKLVELNVSSNNLTSLDVSNNTKLESLDCYDNSLTSLVVIKQPSLRHLNCSQNQLKSLLVYSPWLTELYCHFNNLTKLEPACVGLNELVCSFNQLTTLNLSNCIHLSSLACENNQLATLDISDCSELAAKVSPSNYNISPSKEIVAYSENNKTYLECDSNVSITGGNPVAPYVEPTPTPIATPTPKPTLKPSVKPTVKPTATPKPIPVITVAKKSVKATVYVGTQYRINLNGAAAKNYKSSKKKVAVVDGSGLITLKAKGKAKITIKVGKKKRTLTLTVKDPTIPTKVSLNMSGTVAAKKGTTVSLKATLPAGTYSGIKWKSSNKKIATVVNGVVTFKKKGKVTITATAARGKKKAKVKFTVSN